MDIKDQMNAINEYVVSQRRKFHSVPEVSLKEKNTSRLICEELDKFGIAYEVVGEYGVIARIQGKLPGKSMAIRADIDALPITEETNLPFKSTNNGVMHACGHDGHIAILLSTAKTLSENKGSFTGTVYFCFQQAEEIGAGHEPIIKYLKSVGDVKEVLGSHLWADIPAGKISVRPGAVMAGTTSFYITIRGKGGHGSRPDQCLDPINAGVSLISDAIRLKEREMSPLGSNILSFCTFHGGSATNIIPSEVQISGTMRFFSQDDRSKLLGIIDRVCRSTELQTRCEVKYKVGVGLPPVINDKDISNKAQASAIRIFGQENLIEFAPIMASDNFGCYLQEFPGVYAYIGIRNDKKGASYAHHNPKFDLDEGALAPSVAYYLDYILENMGGA